jgi:hypothetical protein
MTTDSVLEAPAFRIVLPDGEAHRVVAPDEASAKRALRSKLEITRLPAGCKVEPWEAKEPVLVDAEALKLDLSGVRETPETPPATKRAKASKVVWKDFAPAEKARHLLEHQTLPDRSWTDEPRLDGEKRSDFIVRLLGDPA